MWDNLDAFDNCLYGSDNNMPSGLKEIDFVHIEDPILIEVAGTVEPLVSKEKLTLL